MKVDVYPVGALKELLHVWHVLTMRRFPAHFTPPTTMWRLKRIRISLRYIPKTILRLVRARNWRGLRNHFNGYLAEPDEFPPGNYRRRCGSGWTKARALRSLDRRLP